MKVARVLLTPRQSPADTEVVVDIPNDDGKTEAQLVFLAMVKAQELGVEVCYYPEIEKIDA